MKKVVIIGPESTGKSTLSEEVAAHFNTVWAPEYAREYLDTLGRSYEASDLLDIASGQLQLEKDMQGASNGLLICDTDLYVIKVWSEHKYNDCDPRILEQIARQHCDLYLLTYIDIPWQDDPQREYPDPQMREYFYHIYRDIVIQSGSRWADIRGGHDRRLNTAVAAIRGIL